MAVPKKPRRPSVACAARPTRSRPRPISRTRTPANAPPAPHRPEDRRVSRPPGDAEGAGQQSPFHEKPGFWPVFCLILSRLQPPAAAPCRPPAPNPSCALTPASGRPSRAGRRVVAEIAGRLLAGEQLLDLVARQRLVFPNSLGERDRLLFWSGCWWRSCRPRRSGGAPRVDELGGLFERSAAAPRNGRGRLPPGCRHRRHGQLVGKPQRVTIARQLGGLVCRRRRQGDVLLAEPFRRRVRPS